VVPASALYFPCIERGVCRACVRTRPDVADAWRYHQARFEQAAVAHRDALVCSQLHELVGPSLPWSLRDVAPRLIFSSESNGGSLATMLRCAQGSQASALVITMLEEEEEELRADVAGAEGSRQRGRQEGAPADPPAATRRTILSPLALRDIDRQSRRALGMRQRLFGAFCPVPWPRTPNERRTSFFGDETTLLFSLTPRAKLYPAAEASPGNFFRCDGERGISVGGDALLPALSISTDLATGRTLPCHTFGNLTDLAASTDEFQIARVQLFDLTPPDDDETAAGKAAVEPASVLTLALTLTLTVTVTVTVTPTLTRTRTLAITQTITSSPGPSPEPERQARR